MYPPPTVRVETANSGSWATDRPDKAAFWGFEKLKFKKKKNISHILSTIWMSAYHFLSFITNNRLTSGPESPCSETAFEECECMYVGTEMFF